MSAPARPLPNFIGDVALRPSFTPRPGITHVVFDFDGTLSWVRHGWPEIMFGVFRRNLTPLPGETEAEREELFSNIVFGLNGRPTIVLMHGFADLVRQRGGPALEAESLRREFQDQLDAEIAARLAIIRGRRAALDAFVVFAARP